MLLFRFYFHLLLHCCIASLLCFVGGRQHSLVVFYWCLLALFYWALLVFLNVLFCAMLVLILFCWWLLAFPCCVLLVFINVLVIVVLVFIGILLLGSIGVSQHPFFTFF